MPVYKLDQNKKKQGLKGVQKTRLILLVSYAILALPLYLDEFVQVSGDLVRDLLLYFVMVSAIIFWFNMNAPKVFSDVRIEAGKDDKTIIKDQMSISISRVRFIRETRNGLGIHAGGRKLWVPKAIKRYDQLKNEIISDLDPEVFILEEAASPLVLGNPVHRQSGGLDRLQGLSVCLYRVCPNSGKYHLFIFL